MSSAEATGRYPAHDTDPRISRGGMQFKTFAEADRLFQDPPHDPTDHTQRETGGMMRVCAGAPRVPTVSISGTGSYEILR